MLQFPDLSIIDEYLKDTPAADPSTDPPFKSQPLRNFYLRKSTNLMTLNIALCDWGPASWIGDHLTELIQPVLVAHQK